MGRGKSKKSPAERMWSRVRKTDTCWLWEGGADSGGYGTIRVNGKAVRTHVFSYILHNGSVSQGQVVRHICDVPRCVNPAHLVLGLQRDNVYDMIKRGRAVYLSGDNAPNIKLTKDVIEKARSDYASGQYTQEELSRKYKVSRRQLGPKLKNIRLDVPRKGKRILV